MTDLPITLDALISSVRAAAPDEPLAQLEEAARLKDGIGELTDALLGHFVDQARRGGASWTQIGEALGVTKQAAQQKHTAKGLPRERVTPRTHLALERGMEAAQAWGHDVIEPEHLLLGILAVPECLAAKLLVELGLTHERVEAALDERGQRGTAGSAKVPGMAPATARAATGSLHQSLLLGHNYIGTEHLLLALLDGMEEGSVLADIAGEAGLTADAARTRIVAVLSGLAEA
jgi:hypothetical protein